MGDPPFIHFYDEPIEPIFDEPPLLQKAPDCPDGFVWQEQAFRVTEMLAEWHNFRRRGTWQTIISAGHP